MYHQLFLEMQKIGGFSRFEKLKFWGPKRWNNFLPVFKAPIFDVKIVVFFFYLWPLSSFLPFPSIKKGVAKKTLFYRCFFATPVLQSSRSMKQQPQNKKSEKGNFGHSFWKAFFGPNTRKHLKLCTPLWKLGSEKSSETTNFIERNDVDHLLTLQCGPLIDPKTPQMWTTYWPYNIYIYIYICLPLSPSLSLCLSLYIYIYIYVLWGYYLVQVWGFLEVIIWSKLGFWKLLSGPSLCF